MEEKDNLELLAEEERELSGQLAALQQENGQLKERAERQRQRAREAFRALEESAEEVRAVYGDYDWQREVQNRDFARLVAAGVPARDAYEVVHRREVMRAAMDYAAAEAARRAARTVASQRRRVAENGRGSAAVSRVDPKKLTGQELSDIRQRVMNGEKIRF